MRDLVDRCSYCRKPIEKWLIYWVAKKDGSIMCSKRRNGKQHDIKVK